MRSRRVHCHERMSTTSGTHHSGSGGYDNYKMEEDAAKWQVERDRDPVLFKELEKGEKVGEKVQDLKAKKDPDYVPGPEPTEEKA
ncbi:hypothetical protein COCOBI_16-4220 [Coccomyxa sp. Obi]|nr:hypothetical protein COCOBI_16-4220 [Coccomyxa sp. Obi]